MRPRRTGLWRHPDFVKLWTGETISVFGSLIGLTALPFTAILVLHATPFQMALLTAMISAPGLLVGAVAGVWVDRLPRRPIMIAADLGRFALLGSIPLAAALGVLHIGQIYVVAFLAGVLTMFFDVAYASYLPSLVRREELVEGNSKLTASAAAAEVSGFGIAGWLIEWLSAPAAVLIDALSFLGSAAFLVTIRAPEPPPPAEHRTGMRAEVREGLRAVGRNPVLRAIVASHTALDLASGIIGAVILLYTTNVLGLSPGVQGLIFGVGGLTSLGGAMVAERATTRFGSGRAMIAGLLFTGMGALFMPVAHGAGLVAVVLLVLTQIVSDPARTVWDITQMSVRQAITPDHLLGRVNASIRVLGLGAQLLGALVAGLVADRIGLRATLGLGIACEFAAAGLLTLSPARALQQFAAPEPVTPAIG